MCVCVCLCVCACVCVCVCVCVRVFSLHPFLCMYVLVLRFVSRSQGKSNCHFKIFCFVFLFLYYIIVNNLCGKKLKQKKKKRNGFSAGTFLTREQWKELR